MILAVNKCEFSSISNQTIRIYQLSDHKPGGNVFEVDGLTDLNGNGNGHGLEWQWQWSRL